MYVVLLQNTIISGTRHMAGEAVDVPEALAEKLEAEEIGYIAEITQEEVTELEKELEAQDEETSEVTSDDESPNEEVSEDEPLTEEVEEEKPVEPTQEKKRSTRRKPVAK